jgi:hypothetical protein
MEVDLDDVMLNEAIWLSIQVGSIFRSWFANSGLCVNIQAGQMGLRHVPRSSSCFAVEPLLMAQNKCLLVSYTAFPGGGLALFVTWRFVLLCCIVWSSWQADDLVRFRY